MLGYDDRAEWDAPPTLPGVLRRAGYHTYLVGRSMHQRPTRKRLGFDHMVILDHGMTGTDYDEWLSHAAPWADGGYYGAGIMENDWTARPWHLGEHLHPTNWTVAEAMRFLRVRDPSCPFFLVVSFLGPHPPLIPPAFYMDRYLRQDLPPPVIGDWAVPPEHDGLGGGAGPRQVMLAGEALRSGRAGYYGVINHIDDQIHRLLSGPGGIDLGKDPDTVVLFTSDHGEMLGDHYLWRKSLPYEPSARVPLHICAPERLGLQKRLVVDQPVSLVDIMPTLLDAAGVAAPADLDGSSFLPLLQGRPAAWRDTLLYEYYWERNYPQTPTTHALRTARYKYIRYHGIWDIDEFYDLQEDPIEGNNLIFSPEHKKLIADMNRQLFAELARTGGTNMPLYPDVGGTSNLRNAGRGKAADFPPELKRNPAPR
jgi:arylsulfatase A-like enzyme